MDEQDRKTLAEVAEISRENNVMVRKLVRYNRRITLLHTIYWVLIIGSALAAYFSIQPYLTSLINSYSGRNISRVLDDLKINK